MAVEEHTQDKLALPDVPVETGGMIPTKYEHNWMLLACRQAQAAGILPRGDTPQTAYVKMQKGRELGIPPLSALTLLYVVNGRVATMGRMKLALIRKSGRYGYRFEPVADPMQEAKFTIWPRGHEDEAYTAHWTIDRAKARGLTGKNAWTAYQDFMLRWRAVSEAVDVVAPDVCDLPCVEEMDGFDLSPKGLPVLPAALASSIVPEVREVRVSSGYRMAADAEAMARRMMRDLDWPPEEIDATVAAVSCDEDARELAERLKREVEDMAGAEGLEEPSFAGGGDE
jgi:hypothetical protein